jgi:nitroreductase
MEKPATTTYEINDLIKRRWSPRAFREVPVAAGQLHALFEAARWAASSFNEQPWSFIVATRQEEEKFKVLFECLAAGNQAWVERVPVLIMSVAKLTFDRNGRPNRHAYHDVGQALANMAIEATDLGLAVHPMGGFDIDRAREDLEIPEEYDPVAMIAVGHPGDFDELPDDLKADELAPRERKPFQDFVHSGKFGEPMPFESRVKRALMGD